ncbi:MAG TPA: PKD domain-containing protein [Acidimicrobiales bacterium]
MADAVAVRPGAAARGLVATLVATATLAVVQLAGPVPAAGAAPLPPLVDRADDHVTADALPTVQINGVVWDQEIVGNTVYAVGDFTSARPAGSAAGQNETPRSNILAYDIRTGALKTSFAPTLDRQAKAVTASPDGSRIYVGGQFTVVNGTARNRIVALDPTTGAVIPAFNAGVGYTVNDIVATDATVYAGGEFGDANGVARTRLAAFAAANGALTTWAPSADGVVQAMVLAPGGSKLIIGGTFASVNGAAAAGTAALDAQTGASLPWAANQVVRITGDSAGILTLSTDGTSIFGGGWAFGRNDGNLEGTFAADPGTGAVKWIQDCHGDTYSAAPANGYLYVAGHAHYCGNVGAYPQSENTNDFTRRTLSFTTAATGTVRRDPWGYTNWEGRPAPSQVGWYPDWAVGSFTGQSQAAWSLAADGRYLVAGGEFPQVNGTAQQGLVRFAIRSLAPNRSAPRLGGVPGTFPITVRSTAPGQARVSFPANWDRDDRELNYRITRDGATVRTIRAASSFWDRPILGFTDTGLTPGQTYTYRVVPTDDDGNGTAAASANTPVTIATSGDPSPYADVVMADGGRIHWRLGDAPGSATARDELGLENGTPGSGVTFGAPGALLNETDTAATFDGTSTARLWSSTKTWGMDTFTVEAWVRTSTTQGGRIIGFSGSQSDTSSTYDRMLYMTNDGRVVFALWAAVAGPGPGLGSTFRTVESPGGLNDSQWHHLAATLSTEGMRLYVDGAQVGSRTDTVTGENSYGWWRVGGDNLAGWPSRPASDNFSGQIDEPAVYATALSAAQVANHRAASGRGQVANIAPTAAFAGSVNQLTVAFNGTGSSDPDGSIASYAWTFGDGTTGTGPTPAHTYAAAGTYTVTLTVTDDDGATGQVSHAVTPVAPPANAPPTASFTAGVTGRALAVDGSGSSDPDGSIASYAWSFGDGTTGTGASAAHTYAQAGQYTVRLTVTDDDGATGTSSRVVTATNDPVTVARDTFGRTAANGWGTAELGGAWTVGGSSGDFAVNGGQGRVTLPAASAGRTIRLTAVSALDTEVRLDVSLDKLPAGSGTNATVSAIARSAGSSDYRLQLRVMASGAADLRLLRIENFGTTVVATASLPGLQYTPGSVVHLRFQATGTAPTTLSGRAWLDGQAEPSVWQVQATDATAALQQAGGVGVHSGLAASVTNVPIVVSVDNVVAQALQP